MATKKKMLQAAAGQAGGAGLDITEVFSTYLYEGNGSTQTITNGIDLAGEGGLVWLKGRNNGNSHYLHDSERTITKWLQSQTTAAEQTNGPVTSFNSNGFSLGFGQGNGGANSSGDTFASWTFRKAPKFFDVVTWDGDGVASRTVSHSLGSVPGMIIVKRTDGAEGWNSFHRSLGPTKSLSLHATAAQEDYDGYWNDTSPTDSVFTVGIQNNSSGRSYIAYLFAHNDGDGEFGPDGDQDIIKCGSYTGNGSTDGPEIDLGFEPQWILLKNTTNCNWRIMDTMRGLPVDGIDAEINPNLSNAESTGISGKINISASGFKLVTTDGCFNNSGVDFIYMAIRRGPLAQPESGTEVFDVDAETNLNTFVTTPWPTDLAIQKDRQQANQWVVYDRMRGGSNILDTASTSAENTNGTGSFFSGMDYMDGIDLNFFSSDASNNVVYNWKRAPGFFDVVCWYQPTDSAVTTINHNLGVAPEMIWTKSRTGTRAWPVFHKDITPMLELNTTTSATDTDPHQNVGSTSFQVNGSVTGEVGGPENYISYLFATVPGVSKVGSYTGNGTSQTIDCGFTSGARFVLIKNTSQSDNWYIFDSVRGIVSGADPYLRLNTNLAEQSEDFIDPASSGFAVTGNDPGSNRTGNTYIFYAIA